MKEFYINDQQLNMILQILGEIPAKNVIAAIDMIRNLNPVEKNKEI